jgi:hypothetical protein
MNQLKRKMIQRALKTHKRIFPCSSRSDLGECFTQLDDRVLFWYNTEDKTTHVMARRIPHATREATA